MYDLVNYVAVRNFPVVYLQTVFSPRPELQHAAHQGAFDAEEIKRLVQRTPSLHTALMRVRDFSGNDGDEQRADFVTWILHRATNKDLLANDILKILTVLLPALRDMDAPWATGGAVDIDARNLYTGALEKINVALWAVSWSWKLRASVFVPDSGEGGIIDASGLDPFVGYEDRKSVV